MNFKSFVFPGIRFDAVGFGWLVFVGGPTGKGALFVCFLLFVSRGFLRCVCCLLFFGGGLEREGSSQKKGGT